MRAQGHWGQLKSNPHSPAPSPWPCRNAGQYGECFQLWREAKPDSNTASPDPDMFALNKLAFKAVLASKKHVYQSAAAYGLQFDILVLGPCQAYFPLCSCQPPARQALLSHRLSFRLLLCERCTSSPARPPGQLKAEHDWHLLRACLEPCYSESCPQMGSTATLELVRPAGYWVLALHHGVRISRGGPSTLHVRSVHSSPHVLMFGRLWVQSWSWTGLLVSTCHPCHFLAVLWPWANYSPSPRPSSMKPKLPHEVVVRMNGENAQKALRTAVVVITDSLAVWTDSMGHSASTR